MAVLSVLALILGAVGWTIAQLPTESTDSISSSVAPPPTRGSAADAMLMQATSLLRLAEQSPELLRGIVAVAQPSAPAPVAVPSPFSAERSEETKTSARDQAALTGPTAIAARDASRALVDRMRGSSDAGTRLDTAREILAAHGTVDANDMMLDMSLEVLAQLDPDSVVMAIQDLLQTSGEGSAADFGVAQALLSVAHDDNILSSTDLKSFYGYGSRQVQLAVASALTSRGDDSLSLRLQNQCVSELDHKDGSVRAGAVRDLAAQRDPALLELVVPMLEDPEGSVRLQSVRALELSLDLVVMDRLSALVDDPDPDVQRAARRAVSRKNMQSATPR